MKNTKGLTVLIIITIFLVGAASFCISSTVYSQGKGKDRTEEQSFRAAEKKYVKEVRSLLEGKGYGNSGVTMNRVTEEDGSRKYTVTIHHRKINRLDGKQRKALAAECQTIDFSMENCNFFYKFLETDL